MLKAWQFTTVPAHDKEESETAPDGKLDVFAGFSYFPDAGCRGNGIVKPLGVIGKNQTEGGAYDREDKLHFQAR
jgi:hypothetical protein